MTTRLDRQSLEPKLRQLLRGCRIAYASAAELMVRRHPAELRSPAAGFPELMEDLHRGLLIKVYTEIACCDGRWTAVEKQVGAILIHHLWGRDLRGNQLREAAEGLLAQAGQLSWSTLLGPFTQYHVLRDQVGQVETIIIRLANFIAKCDGLTTPEETDQLQRLQAAVGQVLRGSDTGTSPPWPPPNTRHLRQPSGMASAPHAPAAASGNGRAAADPAEMGRPAAGQPAAASATQLSAEDRQAQLSAALKELDSLVGLNAVKQRIRSLSNFLRLQSMRSQSGLATMPLSLHMAFVGNPGTGKTTVARIVGQILGAMGILSSGHLVETDRAGLVAQYSGQTAPKTHAICDAALGGVLFIDEAYSLVQGGQDDPFGREAIGALLKRMEDDRQQLVVILAGYPDEMADLLRVNPGLSSRINTQIAFDDYSPAELASIFERLCRQNDYVLPAETRHRLLLGLDYAYRCRDRHFGNGRLARNAFENSVRQLADRIASLYPLTHKLMSRLLPADIAIPGVSAEQLDRLQASPHALRCHCTHCHHRVRIRPNALGRRLKCPACQQPFPAPWAQISY